MTDNQNTTASDQPGDSGDLQAVMDRLDQLEAKLVKPEPLDFNTVLRGEIDRVRSKNTFTVGKPEVNDAPTTNANTGADGGKGDPVKTPRNGNAAMNKLIRDKAHRGY